MRFSDSYHALHKRRPQAQTCDILHIRRRNAGYLARKQDAKSDAEIDRSFDTEDSASDCFLLYRSYVGEDGAVPQRLS